MSTLLRDVIHIDKTAGSDDYVLKITDGVDEGQLVRTLRDYVVTDDLVQRFDQALDVVASALRDGDSRAAFLSGSFGSGKSHFMAVLHALLGHDPRARAIPDLQAVISKHDSDLQGRNILRLAFHFLDARSIEETLLGGYLHQIRQLHPGCDLPAVHYSDGLLRDAENARLDVGDDKFLARLNGGAGEQPTDDVWGGVIEGSGTWARDSYDAARAAAPGSEERQKLVTALAGTYFTSFARSAEYLPLDEGLLAVTTHAKSLGYDAVVLFLDELVLWLAFNVRNKELFGREAQKLTKFVESNTGPRPIPLVSFVARQMDLKKYFAAAGGGFGSEQQALDDAFRHQEGRFARIVLGDDNLPYVAQKRLLKPHTDDTKRQLDAAFGALDRSPAVWDVLLDSAGGDREHRGADQEAFRRTYPFSPALVSTLRSLASAMQRDRTALKVMQRLLVDRRDSLTIDDVIPVGDIFDLVIEGDRPINDETGNRIKGARRLYDEKLLPLLLQESGLQASDLAILPVNHPFHAGDRLVKTLLLSAVAPDVPALRELTGPRLAALNHGSIVSPLPGDEGTVVLARVRKWAADVPEIQITPDTRNPIIRVRTTGVDHDSIVRNARQEDNDARRRNTLKGIVWKALGLADIQEDSFGVYRQTRVWRGSRRTVEMVIGSVRDTTWPSDAMFESGTDAAGSAAWRFIVGYPFDAGHGAGEARQRVDRLAAGGLTTRTVVWLPTFLSTERQNDLGRLVILDYVLASDDRFYSHAQTLSKEDRIQARIILENQQQNLRQRLERAVQEAYGAATPTTGNLVDDDPGRHVLTSFDPTLRVQAPVGHDLEAAFRNLIDQAFSATYPQHPRFEPADREVRAPDLAAVLDAVQLARQSASGSVRIDGTKRDAIRRVANPLGVGEMGEQDFHFTAERFKFANILDVAFGKAGLSPSDTVTVGTVRGWLKDIRPPFGLVKEVQDLVIAAWAVLQDRAWYRYGSAIPVPNPKDAADDVELRPLALPSLTQWKRANGRVGPLFGLRSIDFLTGSSLAQQAGDVKREAGAKVAATRALADALAPVLQRLGCAPEAPRLATARAAADLLTQLGQAPDGVSLVSALVDSSYPGSDAALARSTATAPALIAALSRFAWDRLAPLMAAENGTDARSTQAAAILVRLRDAARADELSQPLADALQRAEDEVWTWIEGGGVVPPPPPPPPPAGRGAFATEQEQAATLEQLHKFVTANPGKKIVVSWRIDQ